MTLTTSTAACCVHRFSVKSPTLMEVMAYELYRCFDVITRVRHDGRRKLMTAEWKGAETVRFSDRSYCIFTHLAISSTISIGACCLCRFLIKSLTLPEVPKHVLYHCFQCRIPLRQELMNVNTHFLCLCAVI